MNINRENYEIYFLDFIEGNLTEAQKKELQQFLLENPDLASELDDFDNIQLEIPQIEYSNKNSLKRYSNENEIVESNFEKFCIAYIENDLSENKKVQFLEFLENNEHKKQEFEGYKKIKLISDKNLIFKNKEQLKRTIALNISRKKIYSTIAIAASLLLFFFMLKPEIKQNRSLQNLAFDFGQKFKTSCKKIYPISFNNLEEKTANVFSFDLEEKISYIEKLKIEERNQAKQKAEEFLLEQKKRRKNEMIASIDFKEIKLFDIKTSNFNSNIFYKKIDFEQEEIMFASTKVYNPTLKPKKKLFWRIVEGAVNGFSNLTGKNIRFENDYDEKGRPEKIVFKSRDVCFEMNN